MGQGEISLALDEEMQAWSYACEEVDTNPSANAVKRKSITASNIADELRRLGRIEESLVWAKISCDLWNTNPVNFMVFALSLYRAERKREADEIIDELRKLADFESGFDALSACLSFERELHSMTDLDSVKSLLRTLKKIHSVEE
jgi:hypothetical protein